MPPYPPLCKLEAWQEGSVASHTNFSHRPKVMEKGDNFPSTSSTRYFSDKKTDICPRLFHEKYHFLHVFCHSAILVLKKLFQIIFFHTFMPGIVQPLGLHAKTITQQSAVPFNQLDIVQKHQLYIYFF